MDDFPTAEKQEYTPTANYTPIIPVPQPQPYRPKRHVSIPGAITGSIVIALITGYIYVKNQPPQSADKIPSAVTPVKIDKPAQTFSDASLSAPSNQSESTIGGKRVPTPTHAYTRPVPHTIVEYDSTTNYPTLYPTAYATPVPTTTKAIADYFSDGIKLIGAANNSTTVEENSSLSTMKIEANFRNNAMIESSGKVAVKVYYDGIYKTTLERAEYGAYSATFTYVPSVDPGSHTVRMVINENHAVTETNYSNNEQTITYTVIPDTTPPSFTIDGPYQINNQTCMRWVNLTDNVSVYTDVWAKWKIDSGSWSAPTSENPYGCISASSGTTHTHTVHAEDHRANITEQSKSFTAF